MGYDSDNGIFPAGVKQSIDPLALQQAIDEDERLKKQREYEAQQELALQQQQAQAAQEQIQKTAQEANPIAEAGTAVVGGVMDFADDTVEAAGKTFGQSWEGLPDDWGPQNKTAWGNALRGIVSYVAPTIALAAITKSGARSLVGAKGLANTPKSVQLLGNLSADMAAGTAVDVINRNSEGDNLLRTLKDYVPGAVGWLPDDWATLDSDSPDIKRKKNILEGAGLGLLGSVIEGGVTWARALKGKVGGVEFIPKDDVAKKGFQEITNKSPATKAMDPFTDRILKDEGYRQQSIDELALRKVEEFGGVENIDDFDPHIHSQVADDYETLGQAVRPDGLAQTMVDVARIRKNIGTVDGRPSAFMTPAALRSLGLDDIAGRNLVKKIEDNIKKLGNFEAKLPDGRMMNIDEIESAGLDLYAQLVDPRMTGKEIKSLFDIFDAREFREVAANTKVGVISDKGYAAAMNAIKQLKQDYLNPSTARASAYLQSTLAGEAADAATAARVVGDSVDTTYIQERILDKLEALWYETELNGSVSGWALNNKKLWQQLQNDPIALGKLASSANSSLKTAAEAKVAANKEFFTNIKQINKTNPKYLEPLIRAYELTDGDVNSVHKLTNYMNNVLGTVNKGIIDGNPEIPSIVVQGLWGTLYNAKLSSLLTPVKALSNNFALLLMKPANVMLGATLRGDGKMMHRAWAMYATHMDTTMRSAGDYMSQMFKKVAADPTVTQRADFVTRNDEMLTLARQFADAEASAGRYGPAMKVNFVEMMQKINDHPWVRYSMNFMESGDAFVKSAVGMAEARGRAYDEILKSGGKITTDALQEKAEQIYKTMFDANGILTDEMVQYQSREIAMNLDNEVADGLNTLLNKAPILKTLVMFPRTSTNVLDFVHKHSPLSYFIGDLQKTRTLVEPDEIAQFLSTKGIEYTEQSWKTFRAEVEGRVAMGTMLTTMGGWAWAQGNLTGNGTYDKQLAKFQQNIASKPLRSWKGPDGKWRSYDGIEPVSTFLALIADVMENTDTLGSTTSEGLLRNIGYTMSMNLTNKSFLQGLQPITDIASGQDAAVSRWTSNLFSVGLFNQMSRIMMPGLREVGTDLDTMLRNKWNILDAVGAGKPLPYKYDIIDGSVVGKEDPLTNIFNNLLPFKTSANPSPEKQFLLDAEFDVQPSLKRSLNNAEYDVHQRSRLSQIIGESGYLRKGLSELRNDPLIQNDLKEIQKLRDRGVTSSDADLANSITHIRIRQLLNQSVNLAKRQLAQEVPDVRMAELKALNNKNALRSANYNAITLTNK